MPATIPGDHSLRQLCEWTVQCIVWAEEFGFEEYWIGEHLTAPLEPVPAPDLLIAQALQSTERIKVGPGGHCLPFHHPVLLAHRIAQLDQMAGGRYQLGIALGNAPSDMQLFGIKDHDQSREMVRESLDIMMRIWAADPDTPWEFEGKYWSVRFPGNTFGHLKPHIRPFQLPHPPIGIAGLSPNSGTLRWAGMEGYIPMSLNTSDRNCATHWEAVEAGAAKTGRQPHRSSWRILKEVFVADTDAEARRMALEGPMGRWLLEQWVPIMIGLGAAPLLYNDDDMTEADLTPDYFVDQLWLVGSPETVVEKIEQMHDAVGGFGHLMIPTYDYSSTPEAWRSSLGLFAEQVAPKIAHLEPAD
jgi:alkanesulfonate monooxygenase SsuD/methylene tetrahydromethanopterin reductase-like flavin-dependent oxidoreductase (luciferase family)